MSEPSKPRPGDVPFDEFKFQDNRGDPVYTTVTAVSEPVVKNTPQNKEENANSVTSWAPSPPWNNVVTIEVQIYSDPEYSNELGSVTAQIPQPDPPAPAICASSALCTLGTYIPGQDDCTLTLYDAVGNELAASSSIVLANPPPPPPGK